MTLRALLSAAAAAALVAAPAFAGHHEGDKTMADKPKADIVDTADADGRFSTLVAAVKAAGLEETLRGDGPFTVFAPTNDAFDALPDGTVEGLLQPEAKDQLVAILTYHVVAGKTKSKDLIGKTISVKTVNGADVAVDGTDGVKVNDATVIVADVYTSNGVIHAIDKVILPPAAE
ncbi:MAG: fasciclin domain-containing protein [Pseudomonadota bacterium]